MNSRPRPQQKIAFVAAGRVSATNDAPSTWQQLVFGCSMMRHLLGENFLAVAFVLNLCQVSPLQLSFAFLNLLFP